MAALADRAGMLTGSLSGEELWELLARLQVLRELRVACVPGSPNPAPPTVPNIAPSAAASPDAGSSSGDNQ